MQQAENGVVNYILDNGLQVLLKPVHTAPVVSNWIWYRVGGRNELPGKTGISHWVEHMMFKGTPTFPKGSIMLEVNRNGGILNGFTNQDYTAYFEVLPADRLELGLRIESDRMANSFIDPDEVARERNVIISEREGRENNPAWALHEDLMATAFHVHPYGHMVIGWKDDLHQITRNDLYNHYKMYYGPHNAVLVIAGDFEVSHTTDLIEKLFGSISAGSAPPPVTIKEPPQHSERRVVMRRAGTTAYFQAAYHACNGTHTDVFALVMLEAILSGASFVGPATHRSARLYRALVETEIAGDAGASFMLNIDPEVFRLSGTVREGHTLEEFEAALENEIAQLLADPVSEEELNRVRKQIRAQFAYMMERVSSRARWLGWLEILGDWRKLNTFADNLAAVTADDVLRVSKKYLQPANRTVGWFEPKK